MEPKFMISEVFGTSWKYTKSQIWDRSGYRNILTDCSGYLSGYPPAILFCLYRRGRLRNYRITAKKLGLD